ncbi:hypothetical protein [Chryseobacterium sp. ZHDP1]|uniref:hypothetical protein n=1 Tax=Chryseobacterium sp. ZHDP1 TaxID=2838877 RepID=UPI001BDFC8F0|nr:hypothetical protein [Chryseobacterium sp. ZHDP1]QWA38882.1 hypothetical protein KKI44_01335 [Chryseobacterium sp. ZHDP1]
MDFLYRLKYNGDVFNVRAGGFTKALEKLKEFLKVEISENQVRISSVVRIQ